MVFILTCIYYKKQKYIKYTGRHFLRKGLSSIYEKILVRKMPKSAYKAKYLEKLKTIGQSKAPMPLFETLHTELAQRE